MNHMRTVSKREDVINRQTGKVVGFHETATITLKGRTFTNCGAHVDPERATGYLSSDMRSITSWSGKRMGDARVVSSWPMPFNCHTTNRMHQVEADIDGQTYTGRCAGGNMLWRGRIKKQQ